MNNKKVIGGLLFLVGVILILNSASGITGFVIAGGISKTVSVIVGLALLIGSLVVMNVGKGEAVVDLTSKVKEDPTLLKLARQIEKDKRMQNDINHLIEQFAKGNSNPGIGTRNLFGSINYLRGRNGGRVFYRKTGGKDYEVLGYAIGTGAGRGKSRQERRVIQKLKDLYGSEEKGKKPDAGFGSAGVGA